MTLKNMIPNKTYKRAILKYRIEDLSSSGQIGSKTANSTPAIIRTLKKFLYFYPY